MTLRISTMLLVIAACFANTARSETVEEATNHYFEVMRSGDFDAAAALFDPAEIRAFRSSLSFLSDLPPQSRDELYANFFGNGATPESVDSLTDNEYFSAFFSFAMMQSGMMQVMNMATLEYLGHVMEGENIAHAVTRVSLDTPQMSFENMSVASYVRRGDQWKMKMSADIRSVADRLKQAVGQ